MLPLCFRLWHINPFTDDCQWHQWRCRHRLEVWTKGTPCRVGKNNCWLTHCLPLTDDCHTHWTYLLQILSKLCFNRVAFSGNYEIVAISTDKTTIWYDLDYKADIGQHFHKSEKSTRRCHHHKIIKINLKTLVSPLLIRSHVSKDAPRSTKRASWDLVH